MTSIRLQNLLAQGDKEAKNFVNVEVSRSFNAINSTTMQGLTPKNKWEDNAETIYCRK